MNLGLEAKATIKSNSCTNVFHRENGGGFQKFHCLQFPKVVVHLKVIILFANPTG